MTKKTKRRDAAAIYAELLEVAAYLRKHEMAGTAGRIEAAVRDLKRRPAFRRVARTSVPMTPAVARHIRKVARVNPTWPQHRIAALVGVNPGRVSEVLNGQRRAAP
jgi:hypothetical protein